MRMLQLLQHSGSVAHIGTVALASCLLIMLQLLRRSGSVAHIGTVPLSGKTVLLSVLSKVK